MGAGMPLDVQDTFRRHGREALDFLTYCVMSVNSAPVLVYLVAEYRLRPTMAAALALHDAFCAATAPARVRVAGMVLPPRNPRFQSEMEGLRQAPATLLPPRQLFDFIVDHLWQHADDPVRAAGLRFDPALTPAANLPGGRMSAGQAAFVEKVWRPVVRPALVNAGFWRIATVS
jgi:hypothetical protein